MVVIIVSAWLSSFIKPSLYMFIALIIADAELIIKGPVISVNHSVSDSEKKYYHRCLIGILAVFNIIIITATASHLYRTASCISIVIIFCFISHIACMTEKNRKLYYYCKFIFIKLFNVASMIFIDNLIYALHSISMFSVRILLN